MTKLSRWPVGKEKMSLFLDDFWSAVASLKSKTEARNFFNQFLTHTERKMFAKRFQVAMMLVSGYDYKSIKSRLKVSEVTISKISNWIGENREELVGVAKKILRLKERKLIEMETKRISMKGRSGGTSVIGEIVGEVAGKIFEKKKESSLIG